MRSEATLSLRRMVRAVLGARDAVGSRAYSGLVVCGVATDKKKTKKRRFWGEQLDAEAGVEETKGALPHVTASLCVVYRLTVPWLPQANRQTRRRRAVATMMTTMTTSLPPCVAVARCRCRVLSQSQPLTPRRV